MKLKGQPLFEIKPLDDSGEFYIFKMWFAPPGTNMKLEWEFEKMTLKRLRHRINQALGTETATDLLR